MEYTEIENMLEEAFNEVIEPVDDNSNELASWSHRIFNQGARVMFGQALLKFAEKHTKEVTGK